MTTPTGAQPTLAVYLDSLRIQLRLREVPGDRIGQILAEVESHVIETGLDPVEAFGEPGEYAATYEAAGAASVSGTSAGWMRGSSLKVSVPASLAIWAVLEVVAPKLGSSFADQLAGMADVTPRNLGAWLVVGVVLTPVAHVFEAQLARDTAGSSKKLTLTSRYSVFWSLTCLVLLAVMMLIQELLPTGPTLLSVPGWVLFVGGVLAFLALWRHFRASKVIDPRG